MHPINSPKKREQALERERESEKERARQQKKS